MDDKFIYSKIIINYKKKTPLPLVSGHWKYESVVYQFNNLIPVISEMDYISIYNLPDKFVFS